MHEAADAEVESIRRGPQQAIAQLQAAEQGDGFRGSGGRCRGTPDGSVQVAVEALEGRVGALVEDFGAAGGDSARFPGEGCEAGGGFGEDRPGSRGTVVPAVSGGSRGSAEEAADPGSSPRPFQDILFHAYLAFLLQHAAVPGVFRHGISRGRHPGLEDRPAELHGPRGHASTDTRGKVLETYIVACLLYKLTSRIRPYEKRRGDTDHALCHAEARIRAAISPAETCALRLPDVSSFSAESSGTSQQAASRASRCSGTCT